MIRAAAEAFDASSDENSPTLHDLLLQSLKALLEAPGQGLRPLLLDLHPHHAPVLQAIQHHEHQQHEQQQEQDLDSASSQPPAVQRFLGMAAAANIDQLQELLLRLTHLVDGTTNAGQGAAVALHCLLCLPWPHAYMVGVISAQPGTRQLLQFACRSNNSSCVASPASAGMLSRPVNELLLLPALQAPPEQVGAL
jgi:hypothetical protein